MLLVGCFFRPFRFPSYPVRGINRIAWIELTQNLLRARCCSLQLSDYDAVQVGVIVRFCRSVLSMTGKVGSVLLVGVLVIGIIHAVKSVTLNIITSVKSCSPFYSVAILVSQKSAKIEVSNI